MPKLFVAVVKVLVPVRHNSLVMISPTKGYALFISDLHLSESGAAVNQLFFSFLQTQAIHADALFILGDLFETWLGDDDLSPYNSSVIAAIKKLSASIPVYFMAGNRDFLIGRAFAKASGCTILPDPSVVRLYGKPVLLAHGDALCQSDRLHLIFRSFIHKPWLQRLFLKLPLPWRRKVATGLRKRSKQRTKQLPFAIMDTEQSAIEQLMRIHYVKQIIHGHTHRPSIHHFLLDGELAERVVLNDWDISGNVLIYPSDHRVRLTTITGMKKLGY